MYVNCFAIRLQLFNCSNWISNVHSSEKQAGSSIGKYARLNDLAGGWGRGCGLITTTSTVNWVCCEQMSPELAPWLLVPVCAANLHVCAPLCNTRSTLFNISTCRCSGTRWQRTHCFTQHPIRRVRLLGTIALGMKRSEREALALLLPRVKKEWSYTSAPPHIFMSWCLSTGTIETYTDLHTRRHDFSSYHSFFVFVKSGVRISSISLRLHVAIFVQHPRDIKFESSEIRFFQGSMGILSEIGHEPHSTCSHLYSNLSNLCNF
jgi:hypothetical protein